MTGVSLLGPWPGRDVLDAQSRMLGELSAVPEGVVGLPAVVQLPGRGPGAETVGRTAALLTEMPVEQGPHGWQLADRPGMDLSRSRALLREDLESLAVAGHGYTGPLVVTLRGPWTLAAVLYLARGDRVLSDVGAVRELTGSLADGLQGLLDSVRGAVPGAQITVVLREPMLPDVLGGTIATFSGHGRIAAAPREVVAAGLAEVVAAARAGGAVTVVAHGGSRFASRSLRALVDSGADAIGLAVASVRGPQWEQVAEVVEGGRRMWFGLPREPHGKRTDVGRFASLVTRPWRTVGMPAAALDDVVVHVEASSSVAGGDLVLSTPQQVHTALATAVRVAAEIAERAHA
ncbi:hypothetical protein [Actinotalea sp. K2]|uniref:hypothetical protein n=1 Tax=Actinotalea sp. K2 TaxID=2939438 RepID=UPI002017185F|nr:hypothetical protein [Actinotalea sp. K2]MCL3860484.1 hypothetical protein [Actinotalea sp. K2]